MTSWLLQDDPARLARLRKAQEEYELDDEHLQEGQQGNLMLLLERKAKALKRAGKPTAGKDHQDRERLAAQSSAQPTANDVPQPGVADDNQGTALRQVRHQLLKRSLSFCCRPKAVNQHCLSRRTLQLPHQKKQALTRTR